MKKFHPLLLFISMGMILLSCSRGVVGTWRIVSYEESQPGQTSVVLSNIGTITFNKNGTGNTEISYVIMGIPVEDKHSFKWYQGQQSITIEGTDSDIAKVWFIMERKAKTMKLKSTDGTNQIHRMTLSR